MDRVSVASRWLFDIVDQTPTYSKKVHDLFQNAGIAASMLEISEVRLYSLEK
jgi:hypothetical protein